MFGNSLEGLVQSSVPPAGRVFSQNRAFYLFEKEQLKPPKSRERDAFSLRPTAMELKRLNQVDFGNRSGFCLRSIGRTLKQPEFARVHTDQRNRVQKGLLFLVGRPTKTR